MQNIFLNLRIKKKILYLERASVKLVHFQRDKSHIHESMKMKKSTQAIITVLAALAAGSVSAQSMNKSAMEKDSGWYGEVGYLGLNTSSSALNGSQTPKLIRFVAGKDINENLSIEGMAAMTMSKATTTPSTIETAKYSASTYGLYAKPKIEVATGTQLFARIGVAHTSLKLEDTYSGVTGSATSGATKVSYGFGVQTEFTKTIYGQFDYMAYGKSKDSIFGDMSSKGFTASVGYRF